MAQQRFTTALVVDACRRVFLPVPFDPDEVWGAKAEHHVRGSEGADEELTITTSC